MTTLTEELTALLNKHSVENKSNTPDFILADYMLGCLATFERAILYRAAFYGFEMQPGEETVRRMTNAEVYKSLSNFNSTRIKRE